MANATTTGTVVHVLDDNANISTFKWFGTLDDLVHFVYGNQNGLFGEGTCLYRVDNDSLSIMHEWYVQGYEDARRVYGTWEHASAPWAETMGCYACGGYDGHTTVERAVVGPWRVINPADPTQSYVLACGHVAIA